MSWPWIVSVSQSILGATSSWVSYGGACNPRTSLSGDTVAWATIASMRFLSSGSSSSRGVSHGVRLVQPLEASW